MERRRMNLPTGPDTLCFDKDEFMKVRDTLRRGGPMPRPCGSQALRRVAGNGAVRVELHSDMKKSHPAAQQWPRLSVQTEDTSLMEFQPERKEFAC